MADIYVRSGGSNTSPYDTWAKAATDFATAAAAASAGDRIFISDTHTESYTAATVINLGDNPSNPIQVLSVDDTGDPEPATTLSVGAQIGSRPGGQMAITLVGAFYMYGVNVQSGGTSNSDIVIGNNATPTYAVFDNCSLQILSGSSSGTLNLGSNFGSGNDSAVIVLRDTSVRTNHASGSIRLGPAKVLISGMTLDSGGIAHTTLFKATDNHNTDAIIEDSDLTGVAWTSLLDMSANTSGQVIVRNCKLPASISYRAGTIPSRGGLRLLAHNCSSADTNYETHVEDYAGVLEDETTVVLDASDGTTTLSWKMVSTANCTVFFPFASTPIATEWNSTTGSSVTVTVEVVTDNVSLTNKECWIEVRYLGTSGFPLGSVDRGDRVSNIVLATAANQPASTATWTTTGLTTPVKQKLEATFTPQEQGIFEVTVYLAKPSTTVFVDPKATIS